MCVINHSTNTTYFYRLEVQRRSWMVPSLENSEGLKCTSNFRSIYTEHNDKRMLSSSILAGDKLFLRYFTTFLLHKCLELPVIIYF